jgi:hypothetical protein
VGFTLTLGPKWGCDKLDVPNNKFNLVNSFIFPLSILPSNKNLKFYFSYNKVSQAYINYATTTSTNEKP